MQTHVKDDPTISLEEKNTLENVLNGHSIQLSRILRIGESHKHCDRVKLAMTNHSCHVPVMAGFDKDHKQAADGAPRPMRPVCGADEAPNAQLADTLAEIVNGIADRLDRKLKTVCRSTEEMIHMIEQVNGKRDVVDLVVFSTDIQAMFPSLDIDVMASVAAEEFLKGDLEVNLDDTELGLYLAIMLDRQKLVELGLGDVTHTRKYNRGA